MSLDVPTALLEQAEHGEIGDAEFVDCVRQSLPYAWQVIGAVADELHGGTGEFADNITPAGTIDGVNAVFTLPQAPNPVSSLQLFNDGGQLLKAGGVDYTLSGLTITYTAASTPQVGDVPICSYRF